jgi:hypothetical protein
VKAVRDSSCLLSKVSCENPDNQINSHGDVTELLKINHYKAPRDKLICVLNCCKVIFGLPVFT